MQKSSRVDKLEADFQQVPLVQFFWNFYNIVVICETLLTHIQQRKVKNAFLD